jgi:hypothetical protein
VSGAAGRWIVSAVSRSSLKASLILFANARILPVAPTGA